MVNVAAVGQVAITCAKLGLGSWLRINREVVSVGSASERQERNPGDPLDCCPLRLSPYGECVIPVARHTDLVVIAAPPVDLPVWELVVHGCFTQVVAERPVTQVDAGRGPRPR